MANNNNFDRLSQVDGMISKYFSRYMAPTLVTEKEKLAKMLSSEIAKAKSSVTQEEMDEYNRNPTGFSIDPRTKKAMKAMDGWSMTLTDELIKAAREKWSKDFKVQNDLTALAHAFYVELCRAKNGGKDSKKLEEYATRYVESRFNNLVLEQLAREKIPSNSISYIARHALEGSLFGLGSDFGQTGIDKEVTKKAEDMYDANWMEKGTAMVASTAIDASTVGLGVGAKGVSIAVRKAGASARTAVTAGKVINKATVAADFGFHISEYSVDSDKYLKENTKAVLGDENAVKNIQQGGQKYRNCNTKFQWQLNTTLEKKTRRTKEEFGVDQKYYRDSLLRNMRGNSNKLFDTVKDAFAKNGITVNPKTSTPPKWMWNMSAEKCRSCAASYYGIVMTMKEGNSSVVFHQGHWRSLQYMAQRAYDYARMAKLKATPGSSFNYNENVTTVSNNVLKRMAGRSDKLINEIKTTFSQKAIPYKSETTPPTWMFAKTAKQNRALAASFYAHALEMSKTGQQSIKFGGKVMTFQQVAQRAYDYARAAHAEESFALAKRQEASRKDKEKTESKSSSSSETTNAPTQSSYYQNQQTTAATQPDQSLQSMNQGSGFSDMTGGWGNALDSMGLGDFGTTKKNLGYVMAMLPDMLIGMFTGRNPDLKLGDNLLPLASIVGGAFIKNPLLKMIFMGYGGLNLLNNAGHAAVKQRNESVSKVYRSYSDEPLNPRLSNPAMKGSSMIVNIDRVPVVLNISGDAVAAYEQGKVPLNTLANAVLKKYDENRSLASQGYEQGVARDEEQNVSRQLK